MAEAKARIRHQALRSDHRPAQEETRRDRRGRGGSGPLSHRAGDDLMTLINTKTGA